MAKCNSVYLSEGWLPLRSSEGLASSLLRGLVISDHSMTYYCSFCSEKSGERTNIPNFLKCNMRMNCTDSINVSLGYYTICTSVGESYF